MTQWYSGRLALVADDDEYFRLALSAILKRLGFAEVIETGSFDDAIEQLEKAGELALAIFDLSMPGIAAPASLRVVRESFPVRKLVVVSASTSRSDILRSLEAGAHGFVCKGQGVRELELALGSILRGTVYVPASLAEMSPEGDELAHRADRRQDEGELAHRATRRPDEGELPRLTPRQQDVLEMLVEGKPNKEIARALELGPGTVKVHLAALFRTLGVNNRAAAAVAGARFLGRLSGSESHDAGAELRMLRWGNRTG